MRFISVAVLCLGCACAAELETQQILDTNVRVGERWTVTLHARLRSQPTGLGPYQSRIGPVFQFAIAPRTNLVGGYYWTRVETVSAGPWRMIHRLWGGAERDLLRRNRWDVDTRGIFERYLSTTEAEYGRFRHRVRLQRLAPVSPYTAVEYFLDADGWRSVRYFGGIRTRVGRLGVGDFGYFYETRRPRQGGNRHMISTAVTWNAGHVR